MNCGFRRAAGLSAASLVLLLGWSAPVLGAAAVDWVRAGLNTNRPVWGVRGGLLWSLPERTGPADGPRGLIRLRSPVLAGGGYDLINFIAVEPVVERRRGFSELERSQLDGMPGKRFWAVTPETPTETEANLPPGQLARPGSRAESLSVRVQVEPFENGAHVRLTITQRGDAPDEIELAIHTEPDSASLEYCILTATMGNKARTRQLWLKDGVANSRQLYADYRESDFTPHRLFPFDRLLQTSAGDVIVAVTTDETHPAAVDPAPAASHWLYAGTPVTQYWRKPAGTWREDLHVAVNGRYTYWRSRHPIPGGVAFENFELRERFHEGQRFVFGITRKEPRALGFGGATAGGISP